MTLNRLAFVIAPALLLAACGGEHGGAGDEREGGSVPLGFELAMAGMDGSGEAQAAPALIALTPEAIAARLAAGNVRLIDVRTAEEVAEGMIPGAEHIALDSFDPAALDLSDGREVILYCRSGNRSGVAGERLAAATGRPAAHLDGGIIAWEAAGQPVVKP